MRISNIGSNPHPQRRPTLRDAMQRNADRIAAIVARHEALIAALSGDSAPARALVLWLVSTAWHEGYRTGSADDRGLQ